MTRAVRAKQPKLSGPARRAAFAGLAGTFVEYYDYGLYGVLAAVFAPQFFPAADPSVSTLAALAVFATGYLARPLGGLVFGHIGDRHGRRVALMATILTMGSASFLIGILPTYAVIGVAAPLLLVLLRMAQGFSAGGELLGSVTLVVESVPARRRVFASSLTAVGSALGTASGALVAALMGALLTPEALTSWGWRVPLLLALPLALGTLWLRTRVEDSQEFRDLAARAETVRAPLPELVRTEWRTIGLVVGIYLGIAVCSGVNVYANSYLIGTRHLPPSSVFVALGVAALFGAVAAPVAGALADRFGRKRVLVSCYVGIALWTYPFLLVMEQATGMLTIIAAYAVYMILVTAASAPGYALSAELFPTRVRYSGATLSTNIATIIGSGLTPVVGAALVAGLGSGTAPAIWMGAIMVVATGAAIAVRDPLLRRSARGAEGTRPAQDRSDAETTT